ncbi:KGGVGR-motif variant AAA ATPase [Actinosynnema sp. NPDC053489]|uniref:KGGVGR-motif variant AAA ATPase n=1 Tax=Actinosynnema sp. NPDC053489 TaxID=3363916 RepID=UPI0037C6323D
MAGRIITFYSYKGGTGRSMAVANTAWILAANGLRVLVVDWDLEAPGLHRYFQPFLPDPDLAVSAGVVDLVWKFAEATLDADAPDQEGWYDELARISPYAMSVEHDFPGKGTVDFVPAGRQDATYSALVNRFDWNNFYERLGGGGFIEALKRDMRAAYDYVLVDSRTGLSDTAGICTVQLPDVLVNCFSLGNQAIDGAAAVTASVHRQRRGGDLRVFPVPMRVEDGEQDKLDASRDHARARLGKYLGHVADPERYWGRVEIPYKSFYAYEEILATIGDRPRQEGTVLAATERLVGYLTDGRVVELGTALPERERRALLSRVQRAGRDDRSPDGGAVAIGGPRVFVSHAHESADHADAVRELWHLLRARGVDARLDVQPALRPPDPGRWVAEEVAVADVVLVVAPPRGVTPPDAGALRGALRLLGVVLPDGSEGDLPGIVGPADRVTVAELTVAGVEPLVRFVRERVARHEPRPADAVVPASGDHDRTASARRIADDLAVDVRRDLRGEATRQRLFDPFPIPVRWSPTERSVVSRSSPLLAPDAPLTRSSGSAEDLADLLFALRRPAVVVLGAPGSGKSTAMVRLALRLADSRPAGGAVPVLLPAASWRPDVEDLDGWIARHLEETWSFDRHRARELLDARLVVAVVDGLDELPEGPRYAAMSRLAAADGELPVVVTCRSAEYQELVDGGFVLHGFAVVELRPVALEDAIDYLAATQLVDDERWNALFGRLRLHPRLPVAHALTTPLVIDLVREVYSTPHSNPLELVDRGRFPTDRAVRSHLVESLLAVAYDRRGRLDAPPVPATTAHRWLSHLADHLRASRSDDLAWWRLHEAMPAIVGRLVLGLIGAWWSALMVLEAFLLDRPLRDQPWVGFAAGVGCALVGLLVAVAARPPDGPSRVVPRLRVRAPVTTGTASGPLRTLREDRRATVAVAGLALILPVAALVLGPVTGLFSAPVGVALVALASLPTPLLLGRGAWTWFTVFRIWSALRGLLPRRLMGFLDDAHRRGVLREVGPVYRFRHAALRDILTRPPDR